MKKEINTILGLLSDDVEWGEPENPFNPAGKVYESEFVHLIKFQDNKICKFQEFFDTNIAAEAFHIT